MESARLQDPDEQAMAEEHDTDKAEDHDSDKEEESSEEESEDEEEQEEDVKAQFERIIAGFRDGKLDINTITSKPDEYNYLDQRTNDHNPRNLLHMIAEAGKDTTRALKPLVEHLIKHHRRLMEEKDNSGTTPLQAAIMAGIAKLVDYMCNAYDVEGDVDVVLAQQDSKNNNCLHKAALSKHKYARKIALKLIERVRDTETLRAQNVDGKTPLHIAVEWDRCTESQMAVVRALVAACDAALDVNVGTDVDPSQLSVYRYHEKTRREAKKVEAAKEKKEEQRSSGREPGEGGPTSSSRNAKESSKSVPGGGPKAPDQSRPAPTDQLGRSKEQPQSRYKDAPRERQELPMRGIQRQPTRMDMSAPRSAHPDGSKLAGKTAGTMSPALPKGPGADTKQRSSRKKEAVTEATANEIRDFLKLHYMGTREDHESIVSFLYGPVQGKCTGIKSKNRS